MRFFSRIILSIVVSVQSFVAVAETGAQKAAEISVKAFAQLKSTSNLKLSPDGNRIAYFLPHEGRQVVVVKPIAGELTAVLPPAENAEISWFRWANNDRLILSYAYTASRNIVTTRETRLYGVDFDGKNLTNLIKPRRKQKAGTRLGKERVPAQIQDHVIDWLPQDPDHIMVVLDADLNGRDEVRIVDVRNGKFKEIGSGRRGIQNYQTDQQHEIRLAWGYDKSTFKNMYKSPVSNEWKSIEKTSWGDKGLDLIAFDNDPKIGFARGSNEQGRRALYRINLETDEVLDAVFSHEKVDMDYIVNHPVTGVPAGVQYTVDQPKTIYFDKGLQKIQNTVDRALPDTVNKIVNIQPEKKRYLIFSYSDVEPGVYYLLDMKKKNLNFISETMPGISPDNMASVQPVTYKSRDGVDIPAYLTLPKGKGNKNLPTVVLVHGGPQSRDDQTYDYTVQYLANQGYAVLQPNFRGSTGYGSEFEEAGEKQWGGVMQDDVTDGAKWLIEQKIADPKKICIAGASYGGYAAAMGLIKTPDLFKCGVSISAVLNIPALIAFDKKFIGGKAWTKTMGLEGKNPKDVSPYHQAAAIKAPIMVIHAKDDFRVRYRQAKNMVKKLKKLKKDVTFVTMEDGDHNLDTEASRTIMLEAMGKFLKKHLGG